jgi:flavin-dependent dehydrogenase
LHPGIHFKSNDTFFRIGNAAGEAHPIIGEGMSMAMQSAWLLCGHIVRAGVPSGSRPAAAAQRQIRALYCAEWRNAFTRRLRLASVFAHVAMYSSKFSPPLSVMRHFAPLLKCAAKLSGKVSSVLDADLVASLAAGNAPNYPSSLNASAVYPSDIRHAS